MASHHAADSRAEGLRLRAARRCLEPETLARHEEDLVEGDLEVLAAHGVLLPLDGVKDSYRAFSFQTLRVRDETVRTILRGSAAAVERLDLRSWLVRI